MPSVDDSIQFVKGIGPKKAKLLEKLHIRTLRDALETYPRDYEDRTHITPIAEIDMEDKYAVRAVVGTEPKVNRIRKGLTLVKCTIYDETGTLNVTYFNNPYAAAQLRVGQEYVFYGKVQGFGRGRTMVSPQSEKVAPDADHPGRIVPVYPLTAGLTQRDLERVTAAALDTLTGEWPDPLPELLRAKYRLPDAVDALSAIHRPKTKDDMAQARRRMVFEELFLLCCGLQQLKERRKADSGIVFTSNGLDSFFEALPFTPTGAQRRAIMEIAADCASGRPMNRLVQGDVGSGKTVVAAGLCALAAQNGWQAAFMAPTEILAAQHAETLAPMLDKLGISCTLLTGSMTAAQKRAALAAIETGAAQVVVGTHALIQQGVQFHRLGAVIADEQHRFGVAQRAALSAKGGSPHVLVMSATPIPRTLALIMYGDLDVSVLDEIPPGRSPVETYAVGENMRKRITAFIDKQVGLGGQAYVVCPLIEDSENAETKLKRGAACKRPAEAASAPARGCTARTHEKRGKRSDHARFCSAEIRYSGRNNGYRGWCGRAECQSDGGRGRRPVRSVAAAPAARTCRPRYTAVVLRVLRRGQGTGRAGASAHPVQDRRRFRGRTRRPRAARSG